MQKQAGTENNTVSHLSLATRSCLNVPDMFKRFPYEKLKTNPEILGGSYGKRKLVKDVFTSFFNMVVDDIIDNQITFEFPLYTDEHSYLNIKPITGEKFKKIYTAGSWPGLDFLKTNFTGYRMYFSYVNGGHECKDKEIVLPKVKTKRIIENANNGKVYY